MTDLADLPDGPRRPLRRPSLLLTAAELGRGMAERAAGLVAGALAEAPAVGVGRPVLVLPGFMAGNPATKPLRRWLTDRDFAAVGWELGANHGLTDAVLEGTRDQLDRLADEHGRPVALVGWSLGGLLTRWLAHERPDAVSRVVNLGSPWRAEGERTRASPMFALARRRWGATDRLAEVLAELRQPLPVPSTAVYSRTDGVLSWRACLEDDAPRHESVPVTGSHSGLCANPLALAVVTDRLAQPDGTWAPFDRRSLLAGLLPARLVQSDD